MIYVFRVLILSAMVLIFSGATGRAGDGAWNETGGGTVNVRHLSLEKIDGTAVISPITNPKDKLETGITALIEKVAAAAALPPYENAPVAVIPGPSVKNRIYGRLEEMVSERLVFELGRSHDILSLTRKNRLEIMEKKRLTAEDAPTSRNGIILIFETEVSPDPVLQKLRLRVQATNGKGKTAPGLSAEAVFDYTPESPAYTLYHTPAAGVPYPKGLEENPYNSLDKFAFSLATELTEAYHKGFTAAGMDIAAHEIRVLLHTPPSPGVDKSMVEAVRNALQQAVVSQNGFTCAVGEADFDAVFERIAFYQKYKDDVFEMEEDLFTAGTVLLTANIFMHPDGDKLGAALRAAWRVGPLESKDYQLIPANMTGTYISGFTAKAYITPDAVLPETAAPDKTDESRITAEFRPAPTASAVDESTATHGTTDVCFTGYRGVFEKRLLPALESTENVTVTGLISGGDDMEDTSACYRIRYTGAQSDLIRLLQQSLRSRNMTYFNVTVVSGHHINVKFGAGFE